MDFPAETRAEDPPAPTAEWNRLEVREFLGVRVQSRVSAFFFDRQRSFVST